MSAPDYGHADPAVREALGAGVPADAEGQEALAELLRGSRFLVPLSPLPDGAPGEVATVILGGPDGSRGFPAFTGTDALGRFDPAARPLPVDAHALAEAALQEQCQDVLLDVADGHRTKVPAVVLRAWLAEEPWVSPARDGEVLAEVTAVYAGATLHAGPEWGSLVIATPDPDPARAARLEAGVLAGRATRLYLSRARQP